MIVFLFQYKIAFQMSHTSGYTLQLSESQPRLFNNSHIRPIADCKDILLPSYHAPEKKQRKKATEATLTRDASNGCALWLEIRKDARGAVACTIRNHNRKSQIIAS